MLLERPSEAYYARCVKYGVDPLFILAMFNHESKMGTRYSFSEPTKSWGNTGFPLFGPEPSMRWTPQGEVPAWVKHPVTGKLFPVYETWLDGLEATLARLTSEKWVYYNRTSIKEIFIHPSGFVWAPAGDANDPNGYLNALLAYMNKNTEEEMPNAMAKLATRQADTMLAWNAPNNPRAVMTGGWPDFITVHETANPRPGTNAESHSRFVIEQGGGSEGVSFHSAVDEDESIQLMPWNWVAWHAGDGAQGTGNRDSVAIEMCVNSDGIFNPNTINNCAALIAALMREFGIPITRVVQHNHWSGKNCPANLRANGGVLWRLLLSKVSQLMDVPAKAPGHVGPPIVDTFNWGEGSEGVIVERQLIVFNSVSKKWFRGVWRAETGIVWEAL